LTLPLLQVDQLEAGYATPVVGPLSFQVEPGEVIGLSGPNGTGKSTILKAVADGAQIFSGEIRKRDQMEIGWMEQHPARLAEMPFSGWEYLRYTGANRQNPPGRMLGWLDQRVDSLSGGQFQMLCLWAVLGGPAELLLLDEPTNNLDQEGAAIVEHVLKTDQSPRAVLVVSHERKFLEAVSHRVLEVSG
jgi:ATPase subunit of ABC transporter with duplicated ATPase domains